MFVVHSTHIYRYLQKINAILVFLVLSQNNRFFNYILNLKRQTNHENPK